MDQIDLRAYGKINLGLDVLGVREDGYHDIRMIMQSVRIYDALHLEKRPKEEGITLSCSLRYVPTDSSNIVWKAVQLMRETYGITDGIHADIRKVIPVAAGMAGGSADAAAALVGMSHLYGLRVKEDKLRSLGVTIGADVPFCIMRGTALSEGIGEVLTPLPPPPPCALLVVKPRISVSTGTVYTRYDACEEVVHPDIDAIIAALHKSDLKALAASLGNVLEYVTAAEYPVIGRLKEEIRQAGAMTALMTGSGPTVFGLFEDPDLAMAAKKKFLSDPEVRQVFVTEWFYRRHGAGGSIQTES